MCAVWRGLAVLCGVLLLVTPLEAAFTVSGRSLLNGGGAFTVRGVCYHPRPIGMETAAMPTMGDFCTQSFADLHARDLPRIRAMGINVLRVYGWDVSADHKAFLDACHNGGVDPIHVIVNRWIWEQTDWDDAAAVDALCSQFAAIEDGLGKHPAVLALALGNEVNLVTPSGKTVANGANPAYWAAMQRVASAVKARNPERLVTVPINDNLAHLAVGEPLMSALDFWSYQAYRGAGFGSLFADYAAVSARPLLLTEFGMDAFDHASGKEYPNNGYTAAQALVSLWQGIAAAKAVCAGGCVFEYADDWGKVGGAGTQEAGPWAHPAFPDGWMDEEWWGLFAVAKAGGGQPDVLAPRAAVAELSALWRAQASQEGRAEEPRLVNVSTRAKVGSGLEAGVAGFIVRGSAPRLLLVRVVGPALGEIFAKVGMEGALEDPKLTVFDGASRAVAANDNWGDAPNKAELIAVTATHTGLPLAEGSKDAAYLGLFAPGTYTVQAEPSAGAPGIALIEVYEVR